MQRAELVSIRDYEENDKNFIFATMLRGLYYGSKPNRWYGEVPKDIFMEAYHKVIENLIRLPGVQVKMACLKDDPEVLLGYTITTHNGEILHFAYVKSAWRNIGLAKALAGTSVKSVTHLTDVGASILKTHDGVIFNPFLIL